MARTPKAKSSAKTATRGRTRTPRKRVRPTLRVRLSGGPGEGIVLHRAIPNRPTSRYLMREVFE